MNEIKQQFKITGLYKENKRTFYTVNYKGEEYFVPMLRYQVERGGSPNFINCVIKNENGIIRIIQDISEVIKELYQVGGIYSFKVKEKQSNYYVVTDRNGLLLRLVDFGSKQLTTGQNIMARVTSIKIVQVCLSLVEENENEERITFYDDIKLKESLNSDDESISYFKQLLLYNNNFNEVRELYEAKDGTWIIEAINLLDQLLLNHDDNHFSGQKILELFQKLCIHILEESTILKKMPSAERNRYIAQISNAAQHAEDYKEAYSIYDNKRSEIYIRQQLDNLKESENLYQPERKFRIMMCLFNLDEVLMAKMIDQIFQIIIDGNKEHWYTEPFRTAFVNLLEMFINEYRFKATRSSGTDMIHKVIKAIAIQQLLSNGDDDIDRRLNRATYFRLLSYIRRKESLNILDDSFVSLFTQYDNKIEYQWEDISSVENLHYKAAIRERSKSYINNFQAQKYEAEQLELQVNRSGVYLKPISGYYNPVNLNGIISWQNLTISSFLPVKKKIGSNSMLDTVARFWAEVDNNMKPEFGQLQKHKISPSLNDTVTVKITDESEDGDAFYCEICNDIFEGQGWLELRDITTYIQPSPDILDCFKDENGEYLLYEVKVIEEADGNGEYSFSMHDLISQYTGYAYDKDDIITCSIRSRWYDNGTQYFVAVSTEGISCLVLSKDGTILMEGDMIEARVCLMKDNGQLICQYENRMKNTNFSIIDAFRNLLQSVALADESQNVIDDTMNIDTIKEMIGILDRVSTLHENRCQSYSLLSVAGLFSKMIKDPRYIEYYEKRKAIIKATEEYERNGYVDEEKLEKLLQSIGDDLIKTDYLINESVTKFNILQSLRHKSSLDTLFKISGETTNQSIRNAADLAISMLLTERFEIPNIQRLLLDKINAELGIKVKASTLKDYGIESQQIEFKSSVIYPAGYHMRPEPYIQKDMILRVICGFLNSNEGGTLYFGVNKAGASCGIDNDLKYLKTDEDGYGRYIHNAINKEMGNIANQCCIDCYWEEDAGYRIYVMKIKPSPDLVKYQNEFWIRQDTETRRINTDEVEMYRKLHLSAYAKYLEKDGMKSVIETVSGSHIANDKTNAFESLTSSSHILTSNWRKNIVESWDEGFGVDTAAYINFMPNWKYKVTDHQIFEDKELCMAVQFSEQDGYLVVGYESGKILTVRMKDILGKTLEKNNSRCQNEIPKFACPAHKDDEILSVWKNTSGEILVRVDSFENCINKHCDGSMTDQGALVHDTKFDKVVTYEIVPEKHLSKFSKFRNQGSGLGQRPKAADLKNMKDLLKLNLIV